MGSVNNLFLPAGNIEYIVDRSGFVYVLMLMCPGYPVFKIGMAKSVYSRMGTIQPELPFESYVLFAFWHANALAQEAYMHEYYAKYRLRGEWFRLPLGTIFELEYWGTVMAASTPPGKLDRSPDWLTVLFYNAPSLLARLDEEFPDEGLKDWVEYFQPNLESTDVPENQKQASRDRLAEWELARRLVQELKYQRRGASDGGYGTPRR